jgi:hypothetical protein
LRADGDAELAARRSGQRLAQRDEVAEGGVIEPSPPLDVFPAEVADVGDGAAERRQPEPQGSKEDLDDRARSIVPLRRSGGQEASSRAAAN